MMRPCEAVPPSTRAARSRSICILLAELHNAGGRKHSRSTTMRHEAATIAEAAP